MGLSDEDPFKGVLGDLEKRESLHHTLAGPTCFYMGQCITRQHSYRSTVIYREIKSNENNTNGSTVVYVCKGV